MAKKRVIHIAEVGLRANDLPNMTAFYQEELGFEIALTEPNAVFFKVGDLNSPMDEVGHGQIFALFKRDLDLDDKHSAFDHIAFEIPNEVYDEELARFTQKGMVIRERTWPDSLAWRGRSFFFKDPEGNVVELIAAKP